MAKETPMENLRFSNSKYPFVKYRNKTEWYGSHFKAYFTCAVPYSNEEKLLFWQFFIKHGTVWQAKCSNIQYHHIHLI